MSARRVAIALEYQYPGKGPWLARWRALGVEGLLDRPADAGEARRGGYFTYGRAKRKPESAGRSSDGARHSAAPFL